MATHTINLCGRNKKNDKDVMKTVEIKDCQLISERMRGTLSQIVNVEFLSWIQQHSIPHILSKKNTLIKSPSGTGKTLSYAIPIIDILANKTPQISRKDGIFVLVIVPTKELAKQTDLVFRQILNKFIWIHCAAIFGENKRKSEKNQIRKGLNIFISSPGRLYDHLINTQALDLSHLQILVFDEADLLFDLGYEQKINDIIDTLTTRYHLDMNNIQTIMLSATLNVRVNKLLSFMKNHVFVDATGSTRMPLACEMLSCNSQLLQTVVELPLKWRLVGLILFLHHIFNTSTEPFKTIIFMSCIQAVYYHSLILQSIFKTYKKLFPNCPTIFVLHGDMEIQTRMKVFSDFSKSEYGILISTDVAARGLDFKNVMWVIQFNPARNPVDYVHRIGRTARAGNKGSAVVFLAPHEMGYLDILKESGMEIGQKYKLRQLMNTWITSSRGRSTPELSDFTVEIEGNEINCTIKNLVESKPDLKLAAAKCYTSLVKAYSSYSHQLRKFFNPKAFHLGHLSDSLGLSDTPNNIIKMDRGEIKPKSNSLKPSSNLKMKDNRVKKSKKYVRPSTFTVSEYTSSVDAGPKTKKTRA